MRITKQLLIGAICLSTIGACSSGSVNVSPTIVVPPLPPPPVMEDVSAVGVISALGSVTVNGVVYDTASVNVQVNGQSASFADLALGQIVALQGSIEVNALRGTADRIDQFATVIGPVESIDASLDRLVVMGQTVLIDTNTIFDPSVDPVTLAGLSVGANAQISGFPNAAGQIVATRIEPDATSTSLQLVGRITGLDTANMLFMINRQTIDYGSATMIDIPGGAPTNDLFVFVAGSLSNGTLIVDQIESLYDADGTVGERTLASGVITRFTSATDFDLTGFPVTTDASTGYVNGTVADLQINADVTIDGEIAAGGASLLANTITYGRTVNPTATVDFPLRDFDEIEVFSVFNVTVLQGTEFSVEVTVDDDLVNQLAVTQIGSTLRIDLMPGNNDIQTLDAVVTLPILNRIDLNGVSNVVLNDFNQTQLSVDIEGVSRLRSSSLVIENLTASVAGVSQLDFADIRPITAANIVVSGVSSATLNMDIGSTLDGSVTGTSSLLYYGTNVALNVTTGLTSSVTKLGETRP